MNIRIYRYLGYVAGTICLAFVCFYGLTHAHLSSKNNSRGFSYDWKGVARKRNIIPIAIIGSGPAGWTAGMYGARAGITSVVFEGDQPGGLLTTTGDVENYPGIPRVKGSDLMEYMRKQAMEFGVQCVADTISEIDFSCWPFTLRSSGGETFCALTVIISTGAVPRMLGIEGEKQYWGSGVSACARCDAALPIYRNTRAIVVGGGDSAIEEALQLEPFSSEVTIVHRRGQLRAAPHVCKRLQKYKKINVMYNSQVKRILGDGTKVTAVELEMTDERTGKISDKIMPVDRVFLAIGHEPRTALFKDVIDTDDQGFIKCANHSQETNIPGVFAAGDVADPHYRQAISAAGMGCKAGIDAINFLQEVGFRDRASELATNFYGVEEKQAATIHICTISTPDEFENFISKSDTVAMVTFYQSDEQSSKKMLEILEAASRKTDATIAFGIINASENRSIADRFHVGKTPCIIAFDQGRLVARYATGIESVEILLKNVEQLASARAV